MAIVTYGIRYSYLIKWYSGQCLDESRETLFQDTLTGSEIGIAKSSRGHWLSWKMERRSPKQKYNYSYFGHLEKEEAIFSAKKMCCKFDRDMLPLKARR